MKLIEFKEFNGADNTHTLNKKKLAITITISVLLVVILIFFLLYVYNKNFRNWADMHVLMKTVNEGTLATIDMDSGEKSSIYTYDKYVAQINVDKLNIYNSSAKQVASVDINIASPIFDSNGKYLVIGDKGKQKVYLISGTRIVWNAEIDGSVTRVSVNENGYVSVVCSGSTYKSIVEVYNPTGNQLFKTYIPNNSVIDSAISSDNKYLSFAEVDTTKTSIESVVKTISIKDAKDSSSNPISYTYSMPANTLIVNLKYHGSKNLLCMCDDGIQLLCDGNMQKLMNFNEENKKYSFAGINLTNTIYEIDESSDGISNQTSEVLLTNTGTKKSSSYTINGIAKDTSSSDDNIAINLGSEVYFINTRGWLIKKYIATQEVKDVVVSDRIAAIIFRDKIEILIL